MATRKPKARTSDLDKDNEPGALYDWDEMAARWDAQLSEPLAAIAPAVSRLSPRTKPAPRHAAAGSPARRRGRGGRVTHMTAPARALCSAGLGGVWGAETGGRRFRMTGSGGTSTLTHTAFPQFSDHLSRS